MSRTEAMNNIDLAITCKSAVSVMNLEDHLFRLTSLMRVYLILLLQCEQTY